MTSVRFGLDSNILVYAADIRDPARRQRARLVVARAARTRRCLLALQSIGEFFHASTRKRLVGRDEAAARAADYLSLFDIVAPAPADARQALAAAADGTCAYWDGLLLATLGRAGCSLLLSEDMQDGATLAGVGIRNPFVGDTLPDELDRLLS
jgi:predicted nucleic acid-binding protein